MELHSEILRISQLSQKEFLEFLSSKSSSSENPILRFESSLNELQKNLIKMDYETRVNLLIELLNLIYKFGIQNGFVSLEDESPSKGIRNFTPIQYMVKKILSCWSNTEGIDESMDDMEGIFGVIGDLAGTYECSKALLKFLGNEVLGSEFPNLIPMILETHIRTRGDEGFVFSYVVERLLEASGTKFLASSQSIISDSDWNILLEVAEAQDMNKYSNDSKDIIEYIKEQRLGTSSQKSLKKPKWILNSEVRVKVPSFDSNEIPESSKGILDLESELDKYLKPSESEFSENSEVRNEVPSFASNEVPIAPLTRNEVIKNFKALGFHNILRDTKNYDELIRHYGPINEIEGVECSSHPRNRVSDRVSKVSSFPCQMLYCMCREIDELMCEDFPTEALDINSSELSSESSLESSLGDINPLWFKGYCEECQCKIPKKEYAVRFPVDGGGWIGCFCSFSCMKSSEIRPMYKSDIHRINEVHTILREIGIYDSLKIGIYDSEN